MASAAEILAVAETLGPTAGSEGWDEIKIGAMLDSGMSPKAVSLSYWEFRMSRTSSLVDVSESGSSRKLSDVFTNAANMAKYWRDKIAEEEFPVTPPGFSGTRPIRRV
jgi:hypothetical protein